MQRLKDHIISKAIVLLLSVILLAPVLVKLNHLFEDHKHEVCITPFADHYHEFEIDCEFYNFTLNTNFFLSLTTSDIPEVDETHKPILSQYHFISDFQQLQFSLRGPPLSV